MLVILEGDALPFDSFCLVFLLFQSKHVLVELLLEFFVGVIDAKLFKRVLGKDLKTKDVE